MLHVEAAVVRFLIDGSRIGIAHMAILIDGRTWTALAIDHANERRVCSSAMVRLPMCHREYAVLLDIPGICHRQYAVMASHRL